VQRKPEVADGDLYCPVHRFDLYKAIRACPVLTLGAKVTWECLVERTWKTKTGLIYSYNQIGKDTLAVAPPGGGS
jgi:hypothetical protein